MSCSHISVTTSIGFRGHFDHEISRAAQDDNKVHCRETTHDATLRCDAHRVWLSAARGLIPSWVCALAPLEVEGRAQSAIGSIVLG